MAGAIKKSTGLTGLTVCKNPHEVLNELYTKTLKILGNLPKESAYKRYTEKVITERSKILNTNKNVAVIEEKIGCGQIEEVIVQAQNEYKLVQKMNLWRPWEELIQSPPRNQWNWPPHK